MTSIYPKDEKQSFPPTYEQATNYPQAPPIPSLFGMHSPSATILQPQQQPMNMYSPTPMVPPPNAGTNPPAQGLPVASHMLITTQSLIYGDHPIQCVCPYCHQTIATRLERRTGLVPWLVCGGILLFGGWLGCCLIPFCMDGLKDTEHYCPNCAVLLGTRRLHQFRCAILAIVQARLITELPAFGLNPFAKMRMRPGRLFWRSDPLKSESVPVQLLSIPVGSSKILAARIDPEISDQFLTVSGWNPPARISLENELNLSEPTKPLLAQTIGTSAKERRIKKKLPSWDSNPYLLLSGQMS
ncbi:unnamed protein product [Adineta ricciae]|uniref:LITAF domain-containing protein n=1 Tax=Adineta ricciae TaxID=249248 RepID=A0A814DXN3_ADIRI|nr:unnamed protein product [Adineta ricciae]